MSLQTPSKCADHGTPKIFFLHAPKKLLLPSTDVKAVHTKPVCSMIRQDATRGGSAAASSTAATRKRIKWRRKRQRLRKVGNPAWWKAALPNVLWDLVFDYLLRCLNCGFGLTLDPFVTKPIRGDMFCHRKGCATTFVYKRRDAGMGKYIDSCIPYANACASCTSNRSAWSRIATCFCSRP
jgi:hypothetical protein